jgi:hypothetical protein
VNIYLALLACVASFAAGWAMARHRQRYTTSAQEQARAKGLRIPEPFRYALSITEVEAAYMASAEKHLNDAMASRKKNSLMRYEPS